MDYELGQAALDELVRLASVDQPTLSRNEAQTRLDLIDPLLGALDWQAPNVRVEVHQDGTYSDYELGHPAVKLVVEAKREGICFTLPAGWSRRRARLSTIAETSRQIEDALDQALTYALRRGIPYAAIANGWQLVVFLASRTDGIPPMDGESLVFGSLNEMRMDFRTLWDNVSRAAIEEAALSRTLTAPRTRPALPRLSARIPSYPGLAPRHEEQQTLQILGSVFVEDLATLEENERHFLLSCYSHSGALSQYALVSREILRTRYSLLFDDSPNYTLTPASTHTGLDPNLLGDIAAASLKQRPILLLGDVGVGKSTFIKNLIHVAARDQLEQALVFYLDFGRRPTLTQDLHSHVANELQRQLRDIHLVDIFADSFVRGVYHGQLEQFRQSIFGPLRESDAAEYDAREIAFLATLQDDLEQHLKASLDHISKARRKQVVVFLDNVDQRERSFQEQLFIIAQTMAESWPVTVFLALRPETFYESRRSGSLTAYQPRAFTISPPRVEIVLRKRLAYALELLSAGGLRTRTGVEISVDLTTLVLYMETVQRSLNTNSELMEFLENVSNGNIREALGYLELYIGSPHVDLRRMLTIIRSTGSSGYTIPMRDFARSVMLGDNAYYDPDRSSLGNLLDCGGAGRADHFLLPVLIEYLQIRSSSGAADGYVETGEIYDLLQNRGFDVDSIASGLSAALTNRFVSRSGFDRNAGQAARAYRVTPCGAYVVRKLLRSFAYLDVIIDATPITVPEFYSSLSPLSHERELDARLRRCERFVGYLDDCWSAVRSDSLDLPFNWESVASDVQNDIRRIRERLTRA